MKLTSAQGNGLCKSNAVRSIKKFSSFGPRVALNSGRYSVAARSTELEGATIVSPTSAPSTPNAEPEIQPQTTSGRISLSIRTTDAKRDLRFCEATLKGARMILVEGVREDSAVFRQGGVRAGMRLTHIQDPVRNELWQLEDRVSLTNVMYALRMRTNQWVDMELEPLPEGVLEVVTIGASKMRPAARPSTPESDGDSSPSSSPSSSSNGNGTGALPPRAMSPLERRLQRRKDYMEEVGQRDDSKFFAGLGAAFLVPPMAILWAASSSGYLDFLMRKGF